MSTPLTRRFAALPLGRQLGLVVVLSLLPALALMGFASFSTIRAREDDTRRQATTIAVSQASFVARSLDEISLMAGTVTRAPFVLALEQVESQELLDRLAVSRPDVLGIVLVDQAGTEIARFEQSRGVPRPPHRGATAVSTAPRVVELIDGGPVQLALWFPVDADAGPAAIGFFMTLEGLGGVLGSLDMPEGAFVGLSDVNGRFVAHGTNPAIVGESARPIGAIAAGAVVDEPRRIGLDGVVRVAVEAPVSDYPFTVRVGFPVSTFTGDALASLRNDMVILGVALGVWLVFAFVLARRLTRGVGVLDEVAARIASGDLSPVAQTPMPSRELAELQNGFATMVERLDASRRELDRQMEEERRMRREVESLQSQVVRQERLAAVGQLVSGVAHEINNPLQAIVGFAELIRLEKDLPESVQHDVRLIQQESNRACAIVRNLATFARQQPGEAEPVKLGAVIAAVTELRQHRMEIDGIELRFDDAARRPVRAIATELQQVVLNLVINAEQAIESGASGVRRLTIRTRDEDAHVVLEVEDTGPGVDPKDEGKLFEPFFTTKPVGQGTGLGLSVSYGIIDSMGGRLGYRRAESGGAIFYFELPATTEAPAGTPAG